MTAPDPTTTRRLAVARGFTIAHLMASIAILSAFALLAIEVAVISLRVPAQAAGRENGLLLEAAAIEQFRADVWSARIIEVDPDGRSVRLQTSAGPMVRWNISNLGALTLSDTAAADEDPGDATMRTDQHNKSSTIIWKSLSARPAGLELLGDRTSGDFGEHRIVLPSPLRIEMKGGKS